MDLEKLTVEQLNALSDDLDLEKAALMAKKKALHAVRCRKVALAEKAKRDRGAPAQTAKATPTEIGAQTKE